jgi:hypothetical protein
MFRVGIACSVVLLTANTAFAQSRPSPIERGSYLVNTIMACGNCHTPRGADGRPVTDRFLAGGGLTLATPAFTVTAPNITPDSETGSAAGAMPKSSMRC